LAELVKKSVAPHTYLLPLLFFFVWIALLIIALV
jgi:hypothetical protein